LWKTQTREKEQEYITDVRMESILWPPEGRAVQWMIQTDGNGREEERGGTKDNTSQFELRQYPPRQHLVLPPIPARSPKLNPVKR